MNGSSHAGDELRSPSTVPRAYPERLVAVSMDGEASRARRPRYWLIVEHELDRKSILTIDLTNGEKALAVFSFEEEAELFLCHELLVTHWQVRETAIGELVSVIYNLYPGVRKVFAEGRMAS